jgi:cyclophilin family peptidyl-prolyl cis-trans isomerase
MSYRNQRPENRRSRRLNLNAPSSTRIDELDLPGPLGLLGNRKLFFVLAAAAGIAMVVGLLLSAMVGGTVDGPMQGNEAPDVPVDRATPSADQQTPPVTPTEQAVRRYSAPPEMAIDPSRTYTATITTSRGEIEIELYPSEAPNTVNTFVFLAQEGYYNGTPFMELVRTGEGERFYTQAGDPTQTGLGTPGFSIPKEHTDQPFARGAIGMGGSAENSNGGQFFISFDDFPALDGRYTIFGQIVSGLEVLDSLQLLDLTPGGARTPGDRIESITINES